MGREIERKFLVTSDGWRAGEKGVPYCQGYLSVDKARTVRVRIEGDRARLTVKGTTENATRAEFEYPIPVADARAMLDGLCLRPWIEKLRYRREHDGNTWEIDEFLGNNRGLVVAEIELGHPDQTFERPAWVGAEVTEDPRYYNASLVAHPYCGWKRH